MEEEYESDEDENCENDIYTEVGVMDFTDNDEIDTTEEGFMFGYLGA